MAKTEFSDHGITIPTFSSPTGEVQTTCPQCSSQRKKSKAKCLSVNLDKGTWFCHHCQWTGGLGKNRPLPRPKVSTYRKPDQPSKKLSTEAIKWLLSRKIEESVWKRNRLFSCDLFMPQMDKQVEVIAFPYFRNGELVNCKYRAVSEKCFRLESGCELILYGLDDIGETLIWVEGEMDKLAVETAGFVSVVSVPNGAPAPGSKSYESLFQFLDSAGEKLAKVQKHILAVDGDIAGIKLREELSRRLGIAKCHVVQWPEGFKDANELLERRSPDEVRWYIEHPDPYPIEGVIRGPDRVDNLHKLHARGYERGIRTGWSNVDRIYTVKPGELTAVTGIPSSGKSNWLDCLMVNLAKIHGWRFAVFSPENLPVEEHMAAIAEKYIGKPFFDERNQMSEQDVDRAVSWIADHFAWILPYKEDDWKIDNILKLGDMLCLQFGIRGLVIDPWNELESLRPREMSETEYISSCLKRIRAFARDHQIHIWVVVHPAKLFRGKNGKYPIPTLYDCHGSAHWRNKTDNGITVWRDLEDKDGPEVKIIVQKVRFRRIGQRGSVSLYYERDCATYSEFNPTIGRGYQDRD